MVRYRRYGKVGWMRRSALRRKRQAIGEPEAAAGNGLLDRRAFLAAASLGSAAALAPHPAAASELAVEPWMTEPGSAFTGYGQPSKFEAKVVRIFASAPGTITPNGLHFERHHTASPISIPTPTAC
jgi:sulfane dehydrogenase subunit SoxC